ncbi:S-layer homology domain-containing protein [Paenibacillus sp. FA6]|uniref:S-layer homology domain-containing protein n=1 Tax=Paenibacillus sp. FA6 TaxID=3413029 RepID=UPI003F6570E0
MKRKLHYFLVVTLLASLFAGFPMQPKAEAAVVADTFGFHETPFSLAPNAFTFPDEGYLESITMLDADDSNNLYVIAKETYANASDIFHFTTDGEFLDRLITRDALAAQLTGADWHTTIEAPTIEPVMMAFSKEGSERYLYIVLKDTNAGFPMIKLDVSTKTVVADNMHVFTSQPSWMQKGKDGLIYISTFTYGKYAILDTTAPTPSVISVDTSLNVNISGIVSTEDGKFLIKGTFNNPAYICDEPDLITCTPLPGDSSYYYSHPATSADGTFSAFGTYVESDNYLLLNGSDEIKIDTPYHLRYDFIALMNNGDLIAASTSGEISVFAYNQSKKNYTYLATINSYRGETYELDYIQMIVNPENDHFYVSENHSNNNTLDEFDEKGVYLRSNTFANEIGKVTYHDGYFFTIIREGITNISIISAQDFTHRKTVFIEPSDILWTPDGKFLASYEDKLEQYSWNASAKELVLEHTYSVGGRYLNMHGDGKQVTFTEKDSGNMYILNPDTHQYVETTFHLGSSNGVMDSAGSLIHHDWTTLSIIEPNYGTVYRNPNTLYSSFWSYYSEDTYLVPKKIYDPAIQKYNTIPVLLQMITPDSDHEALFTTVSETQLYSATEVTDGSFDLGINFPYNGTTLSEIQIQTQYGNKIVSFTDHPETGMNINGTPGAIFHAVIGTEIGKRMAVLQFSNVMNTWRYGTLQMIFFEETGEIVVQAETHQRTTSMVYYTYRLKEGGSYRGFPSGVAQGINLVNDSFLAKHGRPYIPILLKTGNTLSSLLLQAPGDRVLFEENEDDIMLEWVDSNDPALYDKQYMLLSTDPSFVTYRQEDVTGQTSYNLSTSPLIPGIPYYWKVLTVNTVTAEIAMSPTRQFAFKNWVVDLEISDLTYDTAQTKVILKTLNLDYFRKVGIAVSTSANPTVADEMLQITAPYEEVMAQPLTGLRPDTLYYARAFAIDGTQTRYSRQISFTTETFEHSLELENVKFAPTVTDHVYSATVPYEVSVTNATYDQTKGITLAELWVEGVPYAWGMDIPLKVGLNTIVSHFTDALGISQSTVYVTREPERTGGGNGPGPILNGPGPIVHPLTTAFDIWINGDGVHANDVNGEWYIISAKEEKSIEIKISQNAWTGLFVPQGFVELEHQGIEYRFPTANIVTDQMKRQWELSGMTTYSIVLHLQVDEQSIQPASLPKGVVGKGKVIGLKMEVQAGEKATTVERYSRFAQLRFPIDTTDVTTAVRLVEEGVVHIPTKTITHNGKDYAELSLIINGDFIMIDYAKSFDDIQAHWSESLVQELANRRVVNGFAAGSFQPDRHITRAQLAVLVSRALGLGGVNYTDRFKDVSPEAWFAKELEAAVAFDLLQGYEDGSFQGDSLVTREQAIIVLNRIGKLTGIRVSEDAALSALNSHEDANQVSSWAKKDVGAAISVGIVQGRNDGRIAPQEWMTRAELSAVIYRWLLHTDRQS